MNAWYGNPWDFWTRSTFPGPHTSSDILVFASCGRQACTSPETPTDNGAMLFNYDVTLKKLVK